MTKRLKLSVGDVEASAWLNDTDTARKVMEALPIASSVNVWGDEIYFAIPVHTDPEQPRETVELGDIAYWPQGSALCVFFGRTPVSEGDEIRPISPVNVVGRIEGDSRLFRQMLEKLKQDEHISIDEER